MSTLLFSISKKQVGTRFVDMSKEKMFKTFSPNVSKFIYNTGEFFKRSDKPSEPNKSSKIEDILYTANLENKEKIWKSFLKIYPSLCTTEDLAKIFVAITYFYEYNEKSKSVQIELDNPSKKIETISEQTEEPTNIIVPDEMKDSVANAMKKFAKVIKKVKKDKWKDVMEYIRDYLKTGYKGPYSDISSEEGLRAREEALKIKNELEMSQTKKKKDEFVAQNDDLAAPPKENIASYQPPPKRLVPGEAGVPHRVEVARKAGEKASERVRKMANALHLKKEDSPRPEGAPAPLEPPRPFDKPKAMKKAEDKEK